jgi:hypothetical protein
MWSIKLTVAGTLAIIIIIPLGLLYIFLTALRSMVPASHSITQHGYSNIQRGNITQQSDSITQHSEAAHSTMAASHSTMAASHRIHLRSFFDGFVHQWVIFRPGGANIQGR